MTEAPETPLNQLSKKVLLIMGALTRKQKEAEELLGQINPEETKKLYLSALDKIKTPEFIEKLIAACKEAPVEEFDLQRFEAIVSQGIADVIKTGDIEKFPQILISLWDNFGVDLAPGLELTEIQAISLVYHNQMLRKLSRSFAKAALSHEYFKGITTGISKE